MHPLRRLARRWIRVEGQRADDQRTTIRLALERLTAIRAQTRRLRVLLAQEHGTVRSKHAKGTCAICDFLDETA